MNDYDFDVIKISYCKKHKLYWVSDCPECMADQERLNVLAELRDKWAYGQAHGKAVMALLLQDWVDYCHKSKVGFDWWELKRK